MDKKTAILVSLVIVLAIVAGYFIFKSNQQEKRFDRFPNQGMLNQTERDQMMQESITACSEKSEGDYCEFGIEDRVMNGTCSLNEGQLNCMPQYKGGRP